jgi:hypothetical protein
MYALMNECPITVLLIDFKSSYLSTHLIRVYYGIFPLFVPRYLYLLLHILRCTSTFYDSPSLYFLALTSWHPRIRSLDLWFLPDFYIHNHQYITTVARYYEGVPTKTTLIAPGITYTALIKEVTTVNSVH